MDSDRETLRDVILARAQANPDVTPEELAESMNKAPEEVKEVLDESDPANVPLQNETDWEDPNRCPFCGAALEDGGPGFISHINEKDDCAVAFESWREAVSSDIGGEWTG